MPLDPEVIEALRQKDVAIATLARRIAVLETRQNRWAANGLEPLDRMSAFDWLGKPV